MKLTQEETKSALSAVAGLLRSAKVVLERAVDRLDDLLEAEIEEDSSPRPAMVTGNIPVIKGSDMAGEGGEEVGTMDTRGFFERKTEVLKEAAKLDVHDSLIKGDDA